MKVYDFNSVSLTEDVPDVAAAPDQSPPLVHVFVLDVDQVRVTSLFITIRSLFAIKELTDLNLSES